jgi:hypothetical protein
MVGGASWPIGSTAATMVEAISRMRLSGGIPVVPGIQLMEMLVSGWLKRIVASDSQIALHIIMLSCLSVDMHHSRIWWSTVKMVAELAGEVVSRHLVSSTVSSRAQKVASLCDTFGPRGVACEPTSLSLLKAVAAPVHTG